MARSARFPSGVAVLVAITLLFTTPSVRAQMSDSDDPRSLADRASWRHFELVPDAGASLLLEITTGGDGAPWVLHHRGLLRYDGTEWLPVEIPTLGTTERLSGIEPHGDGVAMVTSSAVLVGGMDGFERVPIDLEAREAVPTRAVSAPDGGLWIDVGLILADGSEARTLVAWEGGELRPVDVPAPLAGTERALWRTRSGTTWLATVDGLFALRDGRWRLHMASLDGGVLDIVHLRDNARGQGALEVRVPSAARGIWRWNAGDAPHHVHDGGVGYARALDVDASGDVLVVLDSQEVAWLDHRGTATHPPQALMTAQDLHFAGGGRLWSITLRTASSFDPARRIWSRWDAPRRGLGARIHEILPRSDGSVWLATADGLRVRRADGSTDSIDEIEGRRLGVVTGLAEDLAGNVWITSGSSFRGAYRFDGREWRFVGASDADEGAYFHRIVADRSGRLWFLGLRRVRLEPGTDPGIRIVDAEGSRRWERSEELPSGQVYGFADAGSALWFATRGGLARLRDGEWHVWDAAELRLARVIDVAVDADGRVWFSDGHDGLGTIESDDSARYYSAADGLPLPRIARILADGDGLWLAGDGGVARLRDGVYSHVVLEESEAVADAWPLVRIGDRLLVGTLGVGVLELDIAAGAAAAPEVVITDAVVQSEVAMFHWRATSPGTLIPSHLIETRYRVDDGPWSRWGTRSEIRINLPDPGGHVLSVQSKGLLAEVSPPATATFTVPLPLIRNPWFYGPIYALAVALVLLAAWSWNRREQQRERLRRSEARYRSLFESASDVIVTRDLRGNITSINRAGLELTGFTRAEVEGMTIESILPPDSVRSAERMLMAKLHGGDATVYEAELMTKAGALIPVELSSQLIRDGDRVVGAQAFMRDIRARKHAEESLRNIAMGISAATGDDFFRTLVESLARELDMELALVAVPIEEEGGVSAERPARVRSLAYWGDGRIRDNVEYTLSGTPCQHVVGGGLCAYSDHVAATFPDDEMLATLDVRSYVGTPLRDSARRLLGIMVVMGREPLRDEKLARSMLQIFAVRAAAEIEKMRAEEALWRTEEELRQAQKMEAIGRLAGGIAHDFNNLLTVVNGYTELALDTVDPGDPLHHDLQQIALAGRNASRLTDQLLAFSRRRALDTTEVDPVEVTRSIAPLLERLLQAGDRLELDLEPCEGHVRLGSGQLEQILMNLVSNAVDATPDGGCITISSRTETAPAANGLGPGPLVVIEVADDGVGMDGTTCRRAFEPFFTTKAPGVGTGLGLSTVYGIVHQSGGELEIESALGTGARVRIMWPLERRATPRSVPVEVAETDARGAGTVLLVEDQDMVRKFVEGALTHLGYRVVSASSGREALEYLAANGSVDLLLSDVVMPGMDGFELAEKVRARAPSTQVLLISGYTDREIPQGPDAPPFLQKPFTPSELGARVRELLERRAG